MKKSVFWRILSVLGWVAVSSLSGIEGWAHPPKPPCECTLGSDQYDWGHGARRDTCYKQVCKPQRKNDRNSQCEKNGSIEGLWDYPGIVAKTSICEGKPKHESRLSPAPADEEYAESPDSSEASVGQ